MSDAIEATAAGATRVLFGTVAFICLMVGIEGMTGAEKISVGLSALLIGAGAICAYAAFFWETAKKILSNDAQDAIAKFSQSAATKAALLLAVLGSIILSPFIEQHRWPFSYPADPAIENENSKLQQVASENQDDAAKWRFAYQLRYGPRSSNNGLLECQFVLVLSQGQAAWNRWDVMQPMLELAHWRVYPNVSNQSRPETPFDGVTILSGDNKDASNCANSLGKAIGVAFSTRGLIVRSGQISPALSECKNECVELDIGN